MITLDEIQIAFIYIGVTKNVAVANVHLPRRGHINTHRNLNAEPGVATTLIIELDIEPTPSRLDKLFQELSHYQEDFTDVRGPGYGQARCDDYGGRLT